jgi:hypothetical protein
VEQITFTRCRPYKKNDQAYEEQKNWTAVRQMVGYERYKGEAACRALQALYQSLRLHRNFFQPVMVLVEKRRLGAKFTKRYDVPKTLRSGSAARRGGGCRTRATRSAWVPPFRRDWARPRRPAVEARAYPAERLDVDRMVRVRFQLLTRTWLSA